MIRLEIPKMTCGGCAGSDSRALKSSDAKAEIDIDRVARLVALKRVASDGAILTVFDSAGYPAASLRQQ